MLIVSRRTFVVGASATAALGVAGCATSTQPTGPDPAFARKEIEFTLASKEKRGTIIVNPNEHFLYSVAEGGRAMRYGVGVGSEGFGWSGVATVHDKQEWPDWYPTAETLQRKPEVIKQLKPLQSGLGVPGGPENPLGARAMYLWQNNKDTLYRIHGTNEPWSIGRNVSAGCIRMVNEDAMDLYERTPVGTKVIVMQSAAPLPAPTQPMASPQSHLPWPRRILGPGFRIG
jgi:lipoprotein-anchoring transpeptidase ErfK/SrfK